MFKLGIEGIKGVVLGNLIDLMTQIPFVGKKVQSTLDKEKSEMIDKISEMVKNENLDKIAGAKNKEIPQKGMEKNELLSLIKQFRGPQIETSYSKGTSFGGVYIDDHEHEQLLAQAYSIYVETNALYPEVFPAVRKFEAEVVRMTISVFNGDDNCCGSMTSGGTESILMAIKAYREYFHKTHSHLTKPQMIVATSAHPAFAKAAHYFNIEMIVVPVDPVTFKMSIPHVAQAMNPKVMVIVGSAPGFPHGIMDDISALSEIAIKWSVALHVDCCLGSLLVPFLREIKAILEPFDFTIKGVTSISCDIHKYGYAPKGNSVICYRDRKYFKCQIFSYTEWSGGSYSSPSASGSRSGAIMAAAWTAMISLGQEGYLQAAKDIQITFQTLLSGIQSIPQLQVLGQPDSCIIAFIIKPEHVKKEEQTLCIADEMKERGWMNLACMQKPIALHIQVMHRAKTFDANQWINDLKVSVTEVLKNIKSGSDKYKDGLSPVYGMAAKLPARKVVGDLLTEYTEALLKV